MSTSLPTVSRVEPPENRWAWRRPNCEQKVKEFTLRWRNEKQGDRCYSSGRILIDGRHYCERHAGQVLLTWHLNQGKDSK